MSEGVGQGTARVGILYRKKGYIQSIRVLEGETIADTLEGLMDMDAVEDWMKGCGGSEGVRAVMDHSYLDYFYRVWMKSSSFITYTKRVWAGSVVVPCGTCLIEDDS